MTAPDTAMPRPPGLLDPLRHSDFALVAGATLVSNVGVWMRDTTSAWTVASAPGPHAAVALVQAATALPTFLLALPAGVLADHFDRRALLVLCQLVLAAAGALLALLSLLHLLNTAGVLLIALVAGSAAALAAPAQQAIVPALVPQAEIGPAVALSSVSFNIARVIGPAVGGLLLATAGAAAAYACNAIGYIVTCAALLAIGPATAKLTGRVAFRDELHHGLSFAVHSSGFRRVMVRGMALYLCASCYLALTPLIAHDQLGHSSGIYGALLAATGIGSLLGGVVLSLARRRAITDNRLLAGCSAASAVALALLSVAHEPVLACLALALVGGATLIQLATLNAAAQLLLPETIRGRGLSVYMAATFGCMAVGSLLWGAIAATFSIGTALLLGAFGFALAAFLGRYVPLVDGRLTSLASEGAYQ